MIRFLPQVLVPLLLLAPGVSVQTQSRILQLTFAGDIMIHTANYLTSDYTAIYRSVEPLLRKDDLSFANLEFPVDPSRGFSSYPRFNGTPEYLQAPMCPAKADHQSQ